MIPTIGIVLCLYVFARSLALAADAGLHLAPRLAGGVAAVSALVAVGLLVRASQDASAALGAFMP